MLEAVDAIHELSAENERLTRENTRLSTCHWNQILRAEKAEAERDRLRDALLETFTCYDKGGTLTEDTYAIIDAARAASTDA